MKFYSSTSIFRLTNGIRVCVLSRPVNSVMVECYIRTGSMHEGSDLGCGLSHFLEHMLFQGCKGFPGTAAADTLQKHGCSVNAYTSFDRTVYHAGGPGNKISVILKVLASMIRFPELPEARFLAEREVILREYDRSQDDPDRRIRQELFLRMFPGHPLRIPVIGLKNMISGVTAEMARSYHRKRYTPERCFWVVTGNADPRTVFKTLENLLGDWEENHPEEPPVPSPAFIRGTPAGTEFVFSDTVSRLLIGMRLTDFRFEDLPCTDILFGLLGASPGSRLNRKFELEKQLALELRTFCWTLPGCCGTAGICAVVPPKKLDRLEKELTAELNRIAAGDISDAEIEREKTQQYADHLRQLESIEFASSAIGMCVMESLPPEAADRYQERLGEITPDRVREAAARILRPDGLHITRQLTREKKLRRTFSGVSKASPVRLDDCCGIPLIHVPERSIPLAHFSLILPAGTILEKPGKAGTAKLAAMLLAAGTAKRDENALLAALDDCGADLSVSAGYNSFTVGLNAPKKKFRKALKILTEIMTSPRFGEREFAREQSKLVEYLNSRETAALETAFDRGRRLLFRDHPYAAGPSGTPESVPKLTAKDVSSFYFDGLNRSRAAAGFGGDLDEKEVLTLASDLFGVIPWRGTPPEFPPLPVFPDHPVEEHIPLDRNQTAVTVTVKGQAFTGMARHLPLMMLASAENGLASRLFKDVREDNALAYAVGMDLTGGFHPGWFTFYAQTRSDRMNETIRLLLGEIQRLGTSGLADDEFRTAKESTRSGIEKRYEQTAGTLYSSLLELFYTRNAVPGAAEELRLLKALSRKEVNERIVSAFDGAVPIIVCAGKMP